MIDFVVQGDICYFYDIICNYYEEISSFNDI